MRRNRKASLINSVCCQRELVADFDTNRDRSNLNL